MITWYKAFVNSLPKNAALSIKKLKAKRLPAAGYAGLPAWSVLYGSQVDCPDGMIQNSRKMLM
jgi:hypothetical protein